MNKIIYVDIDGVLVNRPDNIEHLNKDKYLQCFPIKENIDVINFLYECGHSIVLYTSRGMSMYNGDSGKCYRELFELTFNQLTDFGLKFDKLIMGKPHYDIFIDDKTINPIYENFKNALFTELKK